MVVKTAVLKQLEQLYEKKENNLVVLYGREDCEKEQLLRAFCQEKKCFYYRARQADPKEQLAMITEEVKATFDTAIQKETYEECFNRIKSGGPMKLVVVIDEFQYIAKKDPSFIEAIAKLQEKRLYPGPVLIILCTDNISWVEKEMEDCLGKECMKQMSEQMKVEDLNFLEVVRALPEYSVSECIQVYGIVGGVPGYINRWNSKRSLKENICRNILSRNGYLYNAAEELIAGQLRELSVYNTILSCIAKGNQKLNDIYLQTGFSRAKISVYMKNLSTFDIIEKVRSFETGGWDNAKKGIYRIKDHYVHFWFHFIYPNLSDLYFMGPEEFYEKHIEAGLEEYLTQYFSKVCMEYLELLNQIGKLPMKATKMGTWIGKDGTIDIIAQNEIRENMVGICNWIKPEFDKDMCDKMFLNMEQARIKANYFFLFSANSFAKEVKKMAEEDKRFILVDMNEL